MKHEHPNYTLIGRRIKARRKAIHMTQEKLAEHIEMSDKYISYIELAKKKASLTALCRIAKVLNTTLDPLVYGD